MIDVHHVRGASLRRADARIGSTHGRNGRGYGLIHAVDETAVRSSTALKKSSSAMRRKILVHGIATSTNQQIFSLPENVHTVNHDVSRKPPQTCRIPITRYTSHLVPLPFSRWRLYLKVVPSLFPTGSSMREVANVHKKGDVHGEFRGLSWATPVG